MICRQIKWDVSWLENMKKWTKETDFEVNDTTT